MIDFLLQLKEWLDPEFLLTQFADAGLGAWVLPLLIAIIFAETGLMVGFFLPGDSLLFVTGLFTALSETNALPQPIITDSIYLIAGTLIVAAIVGDQTGYVIGRKLGPTLFKRDESFFFKPKYVRQTKAFYDRHGAKTIIIGRFVPIVRTFAPVVAGVVKLDYRTFVSYNVVGGFLWILSMLFLGYLPVKLLGETFAQEVLRPNIKYLTLGIILLSVVPIVTTYFKERKQKDLTELADVMDDDVPEGGPTPRG